MLLWLSIKLTRKQQLQVKVVLAVLLLHILLMVVFFLPARTNVQTQRPITLHGFVPPQPMKVVLLPMHKSFVGIASSTRAAMTSSQGRPSNAKPQAGAQKKAAGINTAKIQNVSKKSDSVKKQSVPDVKKNSTKVLATRSSAKKVEAKKITSSRKVENQPVQPHMQKVEEKVGERIVAPSVAPVASQSIKEKPLIHDQSLPEILDVEGGDDGILYVGRQEYELYQVRKDLEFELENCWQAPAIISDDLSCHLSVTIDTTGRAKEVKIMESSGSKLYDMCTQRAFRRMRYPQLLWGKEMRFIFKGR